MRLILNAPITKLLYIMMYCTMLYCIMMYCVMWYCMMLYCMMCTVSSIVRLRVHFGGHLVYYHDISNALYEHLTTFIPVLSCSVWKILHLGTTLSFIAQSQEELWVVNYRLRGPQIGPKIMYFWQNPFDINLVPIW